MTPRQSARRHLPELDATFDQLKATFGPGVVLEHLATPDGTWGSDPTADWPRVTLTELAGPGAWQSPGSIKKMVSRETKSVKA